MEDVVLVGKLFVTGMGWRGAEREMGREVEF